MDLPQTICLRDSQLHWLSHKAGFAHVMAAVELHCSRGQSHWRHDIGLKVLNHHLFQLQFGMFFFLLALKNMWASSPCLADSQSSHSHAYLPVSSFKINEREGWAQVARTK
jgi:hypothetical protein